MSKIGDIRYTLLGAKSLHDNIHQTDDNRALIQIVLDGTQEYLYTTLNIDNAVINDFISSDDEGLLDFALKSFGLNPLDYSYDEENNLLDDSSRVRNKQNALRKAILKMKETKTKTNIKQDADELLANSNRGGGRKTRRRKAKRAASRRRRISRKMSRALM